MLEIIPDTRHPMMRPVIDLAQMEGISERFRYEPESHQHYDLNGRE
jgi:hypothetical protein